MKTFFIAFLLCVTTTAYSIYDVTLTSPYKWPVVRVIDGDSIVVEAKWLPNELDDTISIRLFGIDTPERGWRARCDRERELAEEVTSYVEGLLIGNPSVEVVLSGWDKFGGRVLGDFVIGNTSLARMLLDKNYAQPYTGSGPKPSWCE